MKTFVANQPKTNSIGKATLFCNAAKVLALKEVSHLAPACEEVLITGALRREETWMEKITLLAVPKGIKRVVQSGLFGSNAVEYTERGPQLGRILTETKGVLGDRQDGLGPQVREVPIRKITKGDPMKGIHIEYLRTLSQKTRDWFRQKGYAERLIPREVRFDLRLVTPDNFGWQMMLMTGGDNYVIGFLNRYLITKGITSKDGFLIEKNSGEIIPTPNEIMIYDELAKVEYIHPTARGR
jgi:DNA polymerase/3'-5' exonuclease PolX